MIQPTKRKQRAISIIAGQLATAILWGQVGPDYDFGNSPILRTLPDERTLIFIGQKGGDAWALDPDKQRAVV